MHKRLHFAIIYWLIMIFKKFYGWNSLMNSFKVDWFYEKKNFYILVNKMSSFAPFKYSVSELFIFPIQHWKLIQQYEVEHFDFDLVCQCHFPDQNWRRSKTESCSRSKESCRCKKCRWKSKRYNSLKTVKNPLINSHT